ncbi:hypothetical protein, partial [Streptomyces sp. 021-3]
VIHRYYTDKDSLEFILGGNDIEREIHLLAVRAERLLANSQADSSPATPTGRAETPAVRRLDRPTSRERG